MNRQAVKWIGATLGIWGVWVAVGLAGEGGRELSSSRTREPTGTHGWAVYPSNPVLRPGAPGTWDAGALGSMSVLKVGELFHMYYEAWSIRGHSRMDYKTLQIGHATSRDGLHWTKAPANPVLPRGTSGAWDCDGTWDPFVLYEDGVFKMWYGGGMETHCDWGYAISTDGVRFVKQGQISHLGNVEDDHVVHDSTTGRYFMYYRDRKYAPPKGVFRASSTNETNFDFAHAEPIRIQGLPDSWMYKFTHVIGEQGKWCMFYGDEDRSDCYTGLATSTDGLHWTLRNSRLILGDDAEVIRAKDDLWLMFYGPNGFFDEAGCDIRVAIYNGKLEDLAGKVPLNK
jgi:hypothetical protein